VSLSVFAHVKWFVEDPSRYPTRYDLLVSLPVLAAFALAALAVAAAWWFQRTFPEPQPVKVLERFAGAGPLVLGLHLGVALLVASILGMLFVPSLRVNAEHPLGFGILAVEMMCGVMFILGLATRAAAVLLALLGIVAMPPFTFESILEQVHILGIAVFMFLVGRGPFSLDRVRGVRPPIDDPLVPAAALALVRVAMGFGIAYTALTEKLLNPDIAQALLDRYPFLNVLEPFGLPDPVFAYLAGVTEFVVGAVLLAPWVTRPVITFGAVLFTASLFVFGWPELLGHLPFYGIMFLLFIAPNAGGWRVRRALQPAA
jgi:uncharacterized membrane protein YphA (DoxX/SURF4 family)